MAHQSPPAPGAASKIRIERNYPVTAEEIWKLWTTSEGIESWWAPDGFKVDVDKLDLRAGGELIYSMTAVGPEQVEFMKKAGMPLSTKSRKTFTEIQAPRRIAYYSLIDFVPGHEPYEQLTVVDLAPTNEGVHVVMTADPMHDDVWTQRLVAGRENELANLAKVIDRRRADATKR
jgi:uncharacterized protein YndB with AHSA1/START domain